MLSPIEVKLNGFKVNGKKNLESFYMNNYVIVNWIICAEIKYLGTCVCVWPSGENPSAVGKFNGQDKNQNTFWHKMTFSDTSTKIKCGYICPKRHGDVFMLFFNLILVSACRDEQMHW